MNSLINSAKKKKKLNSLIKKIKKANNNWVFIAFVFFKYTMISFLPYCPHQNIMGVNLKCLMNAYPPNFSNQTKVQWPSLVTPFGFQKIKRWSFLSQTWRWSVIIDDSLFPHYTCTYNTTLLACMIYPHLMRLSFIRIFSQAAVQPKEEICQGAKHSIFSSMGM